MSESELELGKMLDDGSGTLDIGEVRPNRERNEKRMVWMRLTTAELMAHILGLYSHA